MAQRNHDWIATVLMVVLAVAALMRFSPDVRAEESSVEESPSHSGVQTPAIEAPEIADQLSGAFERVAETIRPAVASVRSLRKVEGMAHGIPAPLLNSPFRDFFGDDLFRRFSPPGRPEGGLVQQGLGTGFVVSEDGYLLTNHHVVADADEVTVQLGDEEYDAQIVGSDPQTDLAVLKIDADNLVPVRLGDSDALHVGQWVVAVGNPFGLESSITSGIVSAKGRSRVGLAEYEDFIQTDAAINPGNSGGPLVNLRGEVVGINTAIFSKSGGYMGIGFAIPVNMARTVTDSLIAEGRVVRGWLGVSIQDLSDDLAGSFGYPSTDGALVGDVVDDGPAEEAGLRTGDIISRFNGKPVEGVDQLRLAVASTRPETQVSVEIFRNGKSKQLRVELGELEAEDAAVRATGGEEPAERLGMSYRGLTDDLARQLGDEINPGGVVVTAVEPFGPAARAGLRVRDVIIEVKGEEIGDIQNFRRLLRAHDLRDGVRLTVLTGGTQRFVFLKTRK